MMSIQTGHRQVVQAGAAAAVAAPFLRSSPTEAKFDKSGKAPVISTTVAARAPPPARAA